MHTRGRLLPPLLLMARMHMVHTTVQDPMTPMLFMLPSDVRDPWGLQFPVAPAPVNLSAECTGLSCADRPPAGSTAMSSPIIAVFDRNDGAIDVVQSSASGRLLWSSVTKDFANFTGKQNRTYFLKRDLPPRCHIKDFAKKHANSNSYLLALFCEGQAHGHNGAVFLSGDIHEAGSFRLDPLGRFNFTTPNFHDHDDIHLIWQDTQWIDYQISFQQWTTAGFTPHRVQCNNVPDRYSCRNSSAGGGLCYADPNGSFVNKAACLPVCMPHVHEHLEPCNESIQTLKYCDNAGCAVRRIVTMRTSTDGYLWSPDAACPGRLEEACGDVGRCDTGYNASGMIVPDPIEDPPELEFCKLTLPSISFQYSIQQRSPISSHANAFYVTDQIKPFRIGTTARLAAHTLLYAPSPQELLGPTYGLTGHNGKGPSCTKPSVFNHTQCHGPHMYTERWVSESGDASNLSAWRRPFKRATDFMRLTQSTEQALPGSTVLTTGPVNYRGHHTWVVVTTPHDRTISGIEPFKTWGLWGVPFYRLAGIYAPANAEFTTPSFMIEEGTERGLWLNAAAKWMSGRAPGDSCDEGCQAYIMVEMRDATGHAVVGGRARNKCVILDMDGPRLPLRWIGVDKAVEVGTRVTLRIFFRDATIFAVGSGAN